MLTKATRELIEKTGKISTRGIANVDELIAELIAAGYEASIDSNKEWIIIPESQIKKTCRYSHW
jgi:hypothetical protein